MPIQQSMQHLLPTYVASSQSQPALSFGTLTLHPTERRLECDGQPVRISSRAFDILLALLEQPGEVIPHRALMARAWPETNVEEANLRVHVAGLRKLLASGTGSSHNIINVPGRGYAITGPVGAGAARPPAAEREIPQPCAPSFETAAKRLIGRDRDLALLAALVQSERLVSLVGAGGVGKTALAVQLVHRLAEQFSGTCYVDLVGASTAEDLVLLLSEALGLPRDLECCAGIQGILNDRKMLIVLDTCDHILNPVAALAAWLRSTAPNSHILLTSRTATRSADERVHVLSAAFDVPSGQPTAQAAPVELFIAAARAGGYCFTPRDRDLPLIASICRQLDENPLAIEIVGSRVGTHGIQGTAILVEDPEWLLTQTLGGAPARHRTIAAMLDWSCSLLTGRDRHVLGCLSGFDGGFSILAAQAAVSDGEISPSDVQRAMSRLLEQSLLIGSAADGRATYRLPNLVRTFARSKLNAGDPHRNLRLALDRRLMEFPIGADQMIQAERAISPAGIG